MFFPALCVGTGLLSQDLAVQLPSALRGLASLFGMGRGVSLSLKVPTQKARSRIMYVSVFIKESQLGAYLIKVVATD